MYLLCMERNRGPFTSTTSGRKRARARALHRTDQRFLAYSAFDSVQKLQLYTEMFWTTPDVFMYVYMHACMHVHIE